MRILRLLKPLAKVVVLAGVGAAGYATRERWLPLLQQPESAAPAEPAGEAVTPTGKVIVNEQAQENLGLTAKPLKPQTFWKTIPVPGMVVDRPGQSDRGSPPRSRAWSSRSPASPATPSAPATRCSPSGC